jgi:SHS2 domain-containing protein
VKNYQLIEHTADTGVRVAGANLGELFSNAALAMFDIIAEERPRTHKAQAPAISNPLYLRADNLEELFVNWLNELLSLSAAKELIFSKFKINKLQDNMLEATVAGRDIKDYRVNSEIKAATYHQLKIEKSADGWQAEVIFDV